MHTTAKDPGTKETVPWGIWSHEVEIAALALGADAAAIRAVKAGEGRSRLQRWYQAGEPIWMAADGLKQLAAGMSRAKRESDDGLSFIRAAARAS
jgi:hypothetical protein